MDECARCQKGYDNLAILISNQLGIGETITYLAGPTFCAQPGFVAANLTETCEDFLFQLLPVSLPMSGNQIRKYAPDLCMTLFELCR